MGRLPAWPLIATLLLSCAAAHGQGIEYHESYAAAVEAAGESHQFVMVIITVPDHPPSEKMKTEVLTSEPVVELVRQYFAPVLIDIGEVRAGKQQLPEPVKKKYVKGGQIQMPLPCAVFYDRHGEQVTRLVQLIVDKKGTRKWFDVLPGALPPENFHTVLKGVSERVAKTVPPRDRRDVTRALARGRRAFERKDYRTAVAALRSVAGAGIPGEEQDQARELLAEIDRRALAKLEDGKALELEEKLGSAIRAYRACVREFHGSQPAADAAERLRAFRDDEALRQRLADYMAARLVAQAEQAIEAGRFGPAAEALDRVLERYKDAANADKARALREKLDSDPEIKAQIRERAVRADAQRLLRLADGYRRNDRAEKAREVYQQIIEEYPETRYAETAKQHLAELEP
ncbi:MAG: tetratricopeptide repeat protein [Planctomycetota bacterium]